MGNAIACLADVREKSLRICKRDWKYRKADWKWLLQNTRMHDPYKGGLYGDEISMSSMYLPYGTCNECKTSSLPFVPNEEEMSELDEAARKKILRAMKGNLWKQFRKGLVHRRTLKLLCDALDSASDTPNFYLKSHEVASKLMKVSRISHLLEKKTTEWISKLQYSESAFDLERQRQRAVYRKGLKYICAWIYYKWWFEPITKILIILNLLQIGADIYFLYFDKHITNHMFEKNIIRICCLLFTLFYIFETLVKILAIHWRNCIKYIWNQVDLIVTSIAIVEGFADYIIMTFYPEKHILPHIRIIIFIRLRRICHVLRVILIKVLKLVRNYASTKLYHSYDVGRGFVFANEAALKRIDTIVDFGPCADRASEICQQNIKEMLARLMEFETKHPAVAFALKSNRAARRILNSVKTVIKTLEEKSVINSEDMKELDKLHFEMTKFVVYAPRTRPVIQDTPNILESIDWIRESHMVQKVNENHIVCSFKTGDAIQEEGFFHRCVYVIAKGIIKVSGLRSAIGETSLYNQLPNTDTLQLFENKPNDEVYEYLTITQTIGLLGYLQRTKSVTSVVCEKDCKLIQIHYSLLRTAEKDNDDLIYCMWRNIALDIAYIILKQEQRYADFTDDALEAQLQKGILPDMNKITAWDVPPEIDDMVLVQGRAKDSVTSLIFDGPTYIQNTSRSLIMLDDVKKRPPIIIILLPHQKYNFTICNHWTNLDEISSSGICNLHPAKKETAMYRRKTLKYL